MSTILNASVLILAALIGPSALGQAPGDDLRSLTVGELKRIYLACNRDLMQGQRHTTTIMRCSVAYEELKRRAFDGDFEKLLAWSRAQPAVR
jgi:hypothetical protein